MLLDVVGNAHNENSYWQAQSVDSYYTYVLAVALNLLAVYAAPLRSPMHYTSINRLLLRVQEQLYGPARR